MSSRLRHFACSAPASRANRDCTRETASHYLDMAGGDLDTAVELYISMGESAQSGSSSSVRQESAPAPMTAPTARQQPSRQQAVVVASDSDDSDGYMEIDRDDSARDAASYSADLDRAIAQRDSERQQAAHLRQHHGVFGRAPAPSAVQQNVFANYSGPEGGGPLSKMFGMPVFCLNASPEITTFSHAKNTAASLFKPLIVNVLDQTMTSLNQNRDIWPHDDVAGMVVEHYCLFQLHKDSGAATEYLNIYPLRQGTRTHQFPIIDILDSFTGMLYERLSGEVAVRHLCSRLRAYANSVGDAAPQSSFASPPRVLSHSSHASMASEADGSSVWSSVGDGGDEDIARAIAASLGDPDAAAPLRPRSPPRAVSSAQKVRDETDHAYKESLMRDRLADEERERARRAEDARMVMERANAMAEAQLAAQEEQAKAQRKSMLHAKFADEPVTSDAVSLAFRCHLACFAALAHVLVMCGDLFIFRFPDGRRVKRRFLSGDIVRSLYEYVELEAGVGPSQVLICTTMPRVRQIIGRDVLNE